MQIGKLKHSIKVGVEILWIENYTESCKFCSNNLRTRNGFQQNIIILFVSNFLSQGTIQCGIVWKLWKKDLFLWHIRGLQIIYCRGNYFVPLRWFMQTPFLSLVRDDESTDSLSRWITKQLLKYSWDQMRMDCNTGLILILPLSLSIASVALVVLRTGCCYHRCHSSPNQPYDVSPFLVFLSGN